MKYRALSLDKDYQLGRSGLFLVDTPQTVAQAIETRLLLWKGEWFLDLSEGTAYMDKILGYGTQGTRDLAIKERILTTPGVKSIVSYSSSVDAGRKMAVRAVVETEYGATQLNLQV